MECRLNFFTRADINIDFFPIIRYNYFFTVGKANLRNNVDR